MHALKTFCLLSNSYTRNNRRALANAVTLCVTIVSYSLLSYATLALRMHKTIASHWPRNARGKLEWVSELFKKYKIVSAGNAINSDHTAHDNASTTGNLRHIKAVSCPLTNQTGSPISFLSEKKWLKCIRMYLFSIRNYRQNGINVQ